MKVKERRELLLSILNKSAKPIKGDELANTLNVSRQVIVQDNKLKELKKVAENLGLKNVVII